MRMDTILEETEMCLEYEILHAASPKWKYAVEKSDLR
jgi:hypothetical protein